MRSGWGMAVRMVQKRLGWKEVGDDDDWQVYWTDTSVALERIMRLKPTQKINHFTGMLEICRKKVCWFPPTAFAAVRPPPFGTRP